MDRDSRPLPDNSRELIRLYEESEWRTIRLEAVRALGRFSDSRSLLFLIDLIRKNEDLSEQGFAIHSLARHQSRGAKLFLKSFYPTAPATLRPALAHALGMAHVFEASPVLLSDLDAAQKVAPKGAQETDPLLLKNLVLALGELKEYRALERIHGLVQSPALESQELMLACLFSLGRLERDPVRMEVLESRFVEDSLLWQVYQSALSQVQIRSQFKLEDYLSKIFESPNPHPVLPFELRAFLLKDLEAGLELFPLERYWRRHLFCLRALPAELRASTIRGIAGFSGEELSRELFAELAKLGDAGFTTAEAALFRSQIDHSPAGAGAADRLELHLAWVEAFLPSVDFADEAALFLGPADERAGGHVDEELAIRFLNLWSERSVGESFATIEKQLKVFLSFPLSDAVFSRLLRAVAELGVHNSALELEAQRRFQSSSQSDSQSAGCRSSILFFVERLPSPWAVPLVLGVPASDVPLSLRALPALGALARAGALAGREKVCIQWIQAHLKHPAESTPERLLALYRLIPCFPDPSFESFVLDGLVSKDAKVRLQSVIAAKAYPASRALSEALGEILAEPSGEQSSEASAILQGRALDSILSHTTLVAKRAALAFLRANIGDEFVVDKIFRDFDTEKKGGPEFHDLLELLLKEHPEHPQWEKLVALRDRLRPKAGEAAGAGATAQASNPEILKIDERLRASIARFDSLPLAAKLALRAAEQPFLQTEGSGNLPIDKAPIVLEFCKALDLLLEKELGQKHLFPRIDRELHGFQTLWQRVGFGEDYPSLDRVLGLLGLKDRISPELFPLHKAKLMSATFFNGKILQDRFKVFDGLRAWAVIFLIFARKLPKVGVGAGSGGSIGAGNAETSALLKLKGVSDEQCVQLAKRLMQLQDLRNPAAHRQTYSDLASLENFREDAIQLIQTVIEATDERSR
jgi:hypothetical protein